MATGTPPLGHMVSVIDHDRIPLRFLIMDCPTENTLSLYLTTFRQHKVNMVVRCCQETYNPDSLIEQGIDFIDLPFRDGGVPSRTKLDEWKVVVEKYAQHHNPCTIAVHCVAGLGRAPVLVALALIDLGLTSRDAVHLVRQKRRGAFNRGQLGFLDLYHHRSNNNKRIQRYDRKQCHYPSSASSGSASSWGGRLLLKLTQRMSRQQHSLQNSHNSSGDGGVSC